MAAKKATSEEVEHLLDAAKARLDANDADGALAFALAAARLGSGGDEASLFKCLEAAKKGASAARERAKEEAGGDISDEAAAELAAARMVRDDMLTRPSVVGDREGGEQILREAMESGHEVVCVRCGALVSRKRWDVHRDVWCPKSGSQGKVVDNEGSGDEEFQDALSEVE